MAPLKPEHLKSKRLENGSTHRQVSSLAEASLPEAFPHASGTAHCSNGQQLSNLSQVHRNQPMEDPELSFNRTGSKGAAEQDPIAAYMRDISQYPLLSRDEEVKLATELRDARRAFSQTFLSTPFGGKQLFMDLQGIENGDQLPSDMFEPLLSDQQVQSDMMTRLTQLLGSRYAENKERYTPNPELEHLGTVKSILGQINVAMHYLDYYYKNFCSLCEERHRARSHMGEVGSNEQSVTVALKWGELQEKRCELANSNLRLVVSVAKWYRNKESLMDAIEDGNAGLMRAVDKFDVTRGYKFSTCATWWIRQSIVRGITYTSRLVRLPPHLSQDMSNLQQTTEMFFYENERDPSTEEAADISGLTPEMVEYLEPFLHTQLTIDSTGGAGSSADYYLDLAPARKGPSAAEVLDTKLEIEKLMQLFKALDPREKEVIKHRFGLKDGNIYKLKEIGEMLGITRERVRQIEAEALEKLQSLALSNSTLGPT